MKIFYDPEGEAPAGGAPPAEAPPAGETPPVDTTPPEGETPPAEMSDFSKWRETLTDESLKKQAAQYNSAEDMLRSNLKMRQKGAEQGIKVPGEDSDPQEVADFRKAMGIPEDSTKYEFPVIEEGADKEVIEASQTKWGEVLQKANVSSEGAKMLMEAFKEDTESAIKAEQEADADFANETKEILAQEWGKDYDANKDFANKAVAELFGSTLEDVQHIQTKDGKFIMDHPAFVMAFSQVGREMSEDGLGEAVTADQKQSARDQANDARTKRVAAQVAGKTQDAQYWDEKEREALALLEKPQSLVGTDGRTF